MRCDEITRHKSHITSFDECTNPDIPNYLHSADRPVLGQDKFKRYHKVYRIESRSHPLIPDSSFNALSCNWSKLIKHKHVSIIKPTVGKDFRFCFYDSILKFKVEQDIEDEHFGGRHLLSCYTTHEPEKCDYSHIVILIKHQIFTDNEFNPYYCEVYTYDEWNEKKCLLRKRKGQAFKKLRKGYRMEMLRTFALVKEDLRIDRQFSELVSLFM